MQQRFEHFLERIMYASRWLMAPVFLGMSLVLLVLAIKFFQELYHFIPHVLHIDDGYRLNPGWQFDIDCDV